ncbi:MAG: polyprenyl diphosphate synthase [Akkermansia sp.]
MGATSIYAHHPQGKTAAPYRLHHGRQRPLGAQPSSAAAGRPRAGADTVERCADFCMTHNIPWLLFTPFLGKLEPPENGSRALMLLLHDPEKTSHQMMEKGVRLHAIGDFPSSIRTGNFFRRSGSYSGNTRLNLVLAIPTAAGEIAAGQKIAEKVSRGTPSGRRNGTPVQRVLDTAGMPDPDLLIRTSGEMRISNFLLWQISYAELYLTDTLWPDFSERDMEMAVKDYARRTRRFGGI